MKFKLLILTLCSVLCAPSLVAAENTDNPTAQTHDQATLEQKTPQQKFEKTFHFVPTERHGLERPTLKEKILDVGKNGLYKRNPTAAVILCTLGLSATAYLIYRNPYDRDRSKIGSSFFEYIFLESIFGYNGLICNTLSNCF